METTTMTMKIGTLADDNPKYTFNLPSFFEHVIVGSCSSTLVSSHFVFLRLVARMFVMALRVSVAVWPTLSHSCRLSGVP